MTRFLAAVGIALLAGSLSHAQTLAYSDVASASPSERELTECLDCQKCENQSLHKVFEDVIIGNSYGSSGALQCNRRLL